MIQRLIFFILILFAAERTVGQSAERVDQIVNYIYNLDFEKVPALIRELNASDPEIAGYLDVDFHWWMMIVDKSPGIEEAFVKSKDKLLGQESTEALDFRRMIYYMYQIRFENYKEYNISKIFTAIRFHNFVQKVDEKKTLNLPPLHLEVYQLIKEFDKCLYYRLKNDMDVFSNKNKVYLQESIDRIEKIENKEFQSFNTLKNYFLGKIYLDICNDSVKAYQKFSRLSDDFPHNKIFKTMKVDCNLKVVN